MSASGFLSTLFTILVLWSFLYGIPALIEGDNNNNQGISYSEWKRAKYECDVLIFEKSVFYHWEFEAWEDSLKYDSCDVEVGHD